MDSEFHNFWGHIVYYVGRQDSYLWVILEFDYYYSKRDDTLSQHRFR